MLRLFSNQFTLPSNRINFTMNLKSTVEKFNFEVELTWYQLLLERLIVVHSKDLSLLSSIPSAMKTFKEAMNVGDKKIDYFSI